MNAFVFATLAKLASASGKMEVKRNEEGRLVQQMQIEAPNLSEEDQYGYVMPDVYRCDSCKAVVFHLNQALEKRQMKNRRMHGWEYVELFEETCNSAFEGYGVKLINGKNTLSGPGLKQPDSPAPGGAFIQMGGQGWTNRLSEMCRTIVYDKVGEEDLYERFHSEGKIPESICHQETRQCSSVTSKSATRKSSKKKKVQTRASGAIAKSKDKSSVDVKYDGATSLATGANKTGQEKVDAIDAKSFLESVALEDGLDVHTYSSKRSRQEWEKLLVSMAGKIFSRLV
jgi:hypothetical protein